MVQGIGNPEPKGGLGEKDILLPEVVELGVPVQYSSGHKLVENADHKRRQNSEDYIIE